MFSHPRHHRGIRKLLIHCSFALTAIALGFLGSYVLNSELRAQIAPDIGITDCDTGLIGMPCRETDTPITGPESILDTWIFSEAVPWWVSFFIITGAGAAVVMIMIGGMMIITSGGNEERRKKGYQTVIWAIVGLLICMFAFVAIAIIENLPLPGTTS